jgi:hypothetical protein
MTDFATAADARAYAESILHDHATADEIDYVAGECWCAGSPEEFAAAFPDDSPAWFALLDAAAYAADWS